jgi:hypothetical protein
MIMNTSQATAKTPGGASIIDDSVEGADPDPNNDGNPSESGSTDLVLTEMSSIGIAKRTVNVNLLSDGCTEVLYEINIENFGNVNLDSLQVIDNLIGAGFTTCDTFYIGYITSDDFTVNAAYDGKIDSMLLNGNDHLSSGDKGAVLLQVVACGCPSGTNVSNSATVLALSPGGIGLMDISVDGSEPDANENGDPTDDMGTTDNTLGNQAVMGVAKRVASINSNSDGTTTVGIEFNIENFGLLNISELQLSDDLGNQFSPCDEFEILSLTSDDYTVNPSYNGVTDTMLLIGQDVLQSDDKGAVLLIVKIGGCDGNTGPYLNTSYVIGKGPANEPIIDQSQNGRVYHLHCYSDHHLHLDLHHFHSAIDRLLVH